MAYEIISQLTTPTSNALDFASVDFTGWFDIQIKLEDITFGTDGAALQAEFYIGGSLISAGYRYIFSGLGTGGTSAHSASSSAATMLLSIASASGIGNATDESYSGVFSLFNPTEALQKLIVGQSCYTNSAGSMRRGQSLGFLADTGTLDGIKFTPSTGTMTAGKATIFGIQ